MKGRIFFPVESPIHTIPHNTHQVCESSEYFMIPIIPAIEFWNYIYKVMSQSAMNFETTLLQVPLINPITEACCFLKILSLRMLDYCSTLQHSISASAELKDKHKNRVILCDHGINVLCTSPL